jgi:antitoxin component YwqK of YwqJK toxin-antitoxin module
MNIKECNVLSLRNIKKLHPDITKNILSDYIDYETLTEITKYSQDFKINPNRVQIKEVIHKNIIKETYIDGDLRKQDIFNKDNVRIEEKNYKNGKLEGKQYDWYENGKLKYDENYKNGQLKYEYNYKNEKLEGKQYEWYQNAQLEFESNYKDGKLEGKQYSWYENGELYL